MIGFSKISQHNMSPAGYCAGEMFSANGHCELQMNWNDDATKLHAETVDSQHVS